MEDAMPDSKLCPKCGQTKPLSAFPKDKNAKLGVHTYCKACRQRIARMSRNSTGWRGPSGSLRLPQGHRRIP